VKSQHHTLASLPSWKRPWYPLFRKVVGPQTQAEWNDKGFRTSLEHHSKYFELKKKFLVTTSYYYFFFYFCTQIQCNTVHAVRPGSTCWFLTRDTTVQFLRSIKRGTGLYLSLSVQIPIPTNIQTIFLLVHYVLW